MTSPNDNTPKIIAALKDVALSVTGTFDLDNLLQNIVETCTTLSNASRGALFLYDDTTRELIMRAEKGNAPELRFNARYTIDAPHGYKGIGLTAFVFLSNSTLVLNSPKAITSHFAHRGKYDKEQYPGQEKCQSWVGIPLNDPTNKKPIGVLKVENTIDRKPSIKFSDQEIDTFKIISDIVASAILKFQHRFSAIQASISRLSTVLKGTERLNIRLSEICSTFKEITRADGASIWLIEGSRLICRSGVGHYEGMEGAAYYDLSFDLRTAEK